MNTSFVEGIILELFARSNKAMPLLRMRLARYPFIFNVARRLYRRLFPDAGSRMRDVICKHLPVKSSVFFVQVGANDGVSGDPLHDLIIKHPQWRGIFIEPVKHIFERLQNNYVHSTRFIFENVAISTQAGVAEFFYISDAAKADLGDALPYWYDQLGSFERNRLEKCFNGKLKPYITSSRIQTVPLEYIFEKHDVTKIDLLLVDAEGYDYKILCTMDFSRYRPKVVLYEHKGLSDNERTLAKELLTMHGYNCSTYAGDTLGILLGDRTQKPHD